LAHQSGALFHTDAAQAAGKIDIDVFDLDVDYLTFSAHNVMGRWVLERSMFLQQLQTTVRTAVGPTRT
jgi:hypothetical protein